MEHELTQAKKILSNFKTAKKMNQIKNFAFSIANATGSNKKIALNPAHFDVIGISNAVTQSGESPFAVSAVTSTITYKSGTAITAAGFAVDYALDDGTLESNLTVTAGDSDYTVRQFLQFMKYNPLKIRKITLQADNTDVFEGQIETVVVDGSENAGKKSIRLNRYFDKFQNQSTKCELDFAGRDGQELAFNVNTLWMFTILNSRTVQFDIEYYEA
jgi:hypothetical protein